MKEGLRFARLLMVLASFWPLFVLWAIKGTPAVSRPIWVLVCLAMVVLPNLVLLVRYRIARLHNDTRTLRVLSVKDNTEHVIVYLFAVLLPLFDANQKTLADLGALLFAFVLVVVVFYQLNLHYLNLAFAFQGLQCYSVVTEVLGANLQSEKEVVVVLSARPDLRAGDEITGVRVSNKVVIA